TRSLPPFSTALNLHLQCRRREHAARTVEAVRPVGWGVGVMPRALPRAEPSPTEEPSAAKALSGLRFPTHVSRRLDTGGTLLRGASAESGGCKVITDRCI